MLAAHGERRAGATNDGVMRLAAALAARRIVAEVGVGFIKGAPSIAAAIEGCSARRILVYPLFMSHGYFTRIRLGRALDAARRGVAGVSLHVLPPLGLDPGLPDLIVAQVTAALAPLPEPSEASLVLLAHGSSSDPASRGATEQVASRIARRKCFRSVRCAFLDEAPRLPEVVAGLPAPIAVFGLFAGDGMHGGEDAIRLIAALDRPDAVLAGTVVRLDGVERLIAAAVVRALHDRAGRQPAFPPLAASERRNGLNAPRAGSSPGR
jgi:sirohydrochlorin ferrochelatase